MRSKGRRVVKIAIRILLAVIIGAMTIWGAAMLYFSPLVAERWRLVAAGAYAAITLLAFLFLPGADVPHWQPSRFRYSVVLFLRIPASNDRDWQPEVAMTPYATINGDTVTIHNVRDFDYRTEMDFTPRWETHTYDLRKLDSGDIVAVYWAGKAIAHIMVSFGFGGQDYFRVHRDA